MLPLNNSHLLLNITLQPHRPSVRETTCTKWSEALIHNQKLAVCLCTKQQCMHTSGNSVQSHLYVWSVSPCQLQSESTSLMCQTSLHAHQLIWKTGSLQGCPASVWSCTPYCGGRANDVGLFLKSTPSGTAQTELSEMK